MTQVEAAVAIVHTRAPEESILLMRRSVRESDPWSGHWSLPGGRFDPEDSDLLHTALRELEEECGIRLERNQMEVALPLTYARRKGGKCLTVAPFLFRVERELPTVLDPLEAVQALWFPLSVLLDPARHCLRCVPGMASDLYFPAIELDHIPLWGFTYRLLSDWLDLGPQERPIEHAGARVAQNVLEFLLSHGLELERDWNGGTAAVRGTIPVEAVAARFAAPGPHIAAISCLEIRPDSIRLMGPALEEYFIRAE